MYRFHVVALPHTQTNKRHNACAYTMKVFNFCKMMTDLGHEVFHYGAEDSNPPCTEHIEVISLEEQQLLLGNNDFKKNMYDLEWKSDRSYWQLCNSRSVVEIKRRKKPKDFLCVIGGACQKPIADAIGKSMMCVEFGIGYRGVFSEYQVYESYAQMHKLWGHQNLDRNGSFYQVVIPNYFDPDDFPFSAEKEDYFLYLGRLVKRKGIKIAVDTAGMLGKKLKIAGQGCLSFEQGKLVTKEDTYTGNHIDFVGFADVKTRGELMSKAKAVFVPTTYIEPFGGVNVEAQMCGTPVITTDWGAFPETVEHGKTGYRCRTLEHFVWAAQNVDKLDPHYIRERAVKNYSLERVGKMYDEYFSMLYNLWDLGWPELRKLNSRTQLDWLNYA